MPITDDGFEKYTEEQIYRRLEADLNERLGAKAEPGSLVKEQLRTEAETLAELQEESLQNVYEAAYLEDATGEELDKVVDTIGLSRKEAVKSTGTVTFTRDGIPTSDRIIPNGTEVQTSGVGTEKFVTQQLTKLSLIDDFSSGSLDKWGGDKEAVSIIPATEYDGNNVAKLPSTSGTSVQTTGYQWHGTTYELEFYPKAGSVPAIQFAFQDVENYCEVVLEPDNNNIEIRMVENGTQVQSNKENLNISAQKLYGVLNWSVHDDTTFTIYETSSKDSQIGSISFEYDRTWSEGKFGLASYSDSNNFLVNIAGTTGTTVNIQAENAGTNGNIPANAIEVISNGLTGVKRVRNYVPVGNDNYKDVSNVTFQIGEDREGDEELRKRAFDDNSLGGAATLDAIGAAVREVENVKSVVVNRNREDSSVNGLPPHSFEVVVYGGSNENIANALHRVESIDSHDVGGVNGKLQTFDVYSETTQDTETISWSSPYELKLNITLDLIVSDSFVGEEEITSIVAKYIGGTDVDGTRTNGLDVGDNIFESILKNRIVDPEETGVWEVNSLTIDSDSDGTDNTVEDTSGADVLEVANNEVALVNARDGSITVNTTQL
jgi:uncharacterized phage protein gp47/JayE